MKNRLLAALLMLTMLSSLAFPVFATEDGSADVEEKVAIVNSDESVNFTWINPIFADEKIDEDTIPEAAPVSSRKKLKAASPNSIYQAESLEDAGEFIRGKMKNRVSTIEFVAPENIGSDVEGFLNRYLNEAWKETEDPLEGDYLRSNTYRVGLQGRENEYGEGTATVILKLWYCSNAAMEEEMVPVLQGLIDSFGFASETTDYEKICSIYDYLCINVTYDYNTSNMIAHSAYAALMDHSSVCQGYASLFYLLARTCGLQARYVSGIGGQLGSDGNWSEENHGWNIVKLGDSYYNLDATWDAGQIQADQDYLYFLRGSSDFAYSYQGQLHSDHIPGKRAGTSRPVYVPEEIEELSTTYYTVPLNNLIIRTRSDYTFSLGRRINVPFPQRARREEMAQRCTYTGPAEYGNGSTQTFTQNGFAGLSFSESYNTTGYKPYFDGMKIYWIIEDPTTGERVKTATSTVHIIDSGKVLGYRMSLGDEISVRIYMDLTEELLQNKKAFIHLDIPGETRKIQDIPVSKGISETIDGKTYYVFSAGVAAKDMTQDLKISCYLDKDTPVMDEVTVTVQDYGKAILEDTQGVYTDADRTMVKAMLNYGTSAQEYFDYHIDNLANSILSPEDQQIPEPDVEGYAKSVVGAVDGLTYRGSKIVLRTKTLIWHYFSLEDEQGSIDDYSFIVNGKIATPEAVQGRQNWYVIKVDGIPAKKLGQDVPVTVQKPGEEGVITIHYSVYSYIRSILNKAETSGEAAVKVVKALYNYGETAKEYFA